MENAEFDKRDIYIPQKNWQVEHKNVMLDFLCFLNCKSKNFVLKGGTSLLLCYRLDRFSEDINLDGKIENERTKHFPSIIPFVEEYCKIVNALLM